MRLSVSSSAIHLRSYPVLDIFSYALHANKTALLKIKKILERRNFVILQHGLHLRLLFYQPVKLDGMRLKVEGVLILCIVVVLAKTCFEKFAPLDSRFPSGKNFR